MSEKSLTILFAPLDGWGHINACIGLAEVLLNRGHRVVFAIDISFKGKLKRMVLKKRYIVCQQMMKIFGPILPDKEHRHSYLIRSVVPNISIFWVIIRCLNTYNNAIHNI